MANDLKKIHSSLNEAEVIQNVSSIFEITSTVIINQVRAGVIASNKFSGGLWDMYRNLKVTMHLNGIKEEKNWDIDKTVSLIVTSSGSFSGSDDEEIINLVLEDADASRGDFIVIGQRGLTILSSRGIEAVLAYEAPDIRHPIDIKVITEFIKKYRYAWAYYLDFESIEVQKLRRVNLLLSNEITEVKSKEDKEAVLKLKSFIFEPSIAEILSYIERVILNLTVTQIIYDAGLSEFANRFKTSSIVNDKAKKSVKDLTLKYNRVRRQVKDEALRQQIFMGTIL